MRKTTMKKSLFLFCAACVATGCANSETEVQRRNQAPMSINGANYASAEANEANVFGSKSSGLSNNPMTKPSSDKLGASVFHNLVVTATPAETSTYINEIIEFEVSYVDYLTEEDRENGKVDKSSEDNGQFVVVLERPSDGNATLIVDDASLSNAKKWPLTETEAVVKAENRSFKFRVLTGNAYNNDNKPMYWINIWNADLAEPVAVQVEVRRPAQIGIDDIIQGTRDVSNVVTYPEGAFSSLGVSSKLSSAVLEPVDATSQQLWAMDKKSLKVKLTGSCQDQSGEVVEGGKGNCSLGGEPICVTFVESHKTKNGNNGYLSEVSNAVDGTDYEPNDKNIITACGVTEDDGTFDALVNTGKAYNARYFTNVFHPLAGAPVTFQIDTFALPESLGEPGSAAVIIDEGLKIDALNKAEIDPDTGKPTLSSEDSKDFLDGLFPGGVDADGNPVFGPDGKPVATDLDGNPIKLLEDSAGNVFACVAFDEYGCIDSNGNHISIILGPSGEMIAVYLDEKGKIDTSKGVHYEPPADANGNIDPNAVLVDAEGNQLYTDGKGNVFAIAGFSGVNSDGYAVDAHGNLILDAHGNPIVGSCALDANGNVIKGADGNPVRQSDLVEMTVQNTDSGSGLGGGIPSTAPVGMIIGKDGKDIYDSETDKRGNPVINLDDLAMVEKDADGNVLTDDKGNPIYVFAKEPVALYASVMEQCMVNGLFMCEASQNEDGSWSFFKVLFEGTYDLLTGEPRDCNPMYDENCGYKNKILQEVLVDLDGDGKKEPINVVVNTDENGNSYFGGFDLDGDGVPDVAAYPRLITDPDTREQLGIETIDRANLWFQYLCAGEVDGQPTEFSACARYQLPMASPNSIFVKLSPLPGYKINDDGEVVRADGKDIDSTASKELKKQIIKGLIVRDSVAPANNARFGEGMDGEETTEVETDNEGEAEFKFWSGHAYNSLYYITTSNSHTNSINIPIITTNNLVLPTKAACPGCEPSPDSLKPPKGAAVTPPSDMDAYDPNLGPVTIEIAPDFENMVASPVVKTLNFGVVVKKDNATKTLVPNTKTFWKVTRGESLANNGSMSSGVATTNKKGIAENSFYTGTGYGSLYYVSVFHPNAYEIDKNGDKIYKPAVFTVSTTNNTGVVPGYDPKSDPKVPGAGQDDCDPAKDANCKPATDKTGKKPGEEGYDSSTLSEVAGGYETYTKYPQGPGCGNNTCSTEDKKSCGEPGGKACCGNSTCVSDGKQGCLEIQIVGESKQLAPIGDSYPVTVRVVWHDGEEEQKVRGNVYWTIDKGPEADGHFSDNSEVFKTGLNSNGESTVYFNTGSKVSTYRLNAMFPNIHDEKGVMIPVSIVVNVVDESQIPKVDTVKNTITAKISTRNVAKLVNSFADVNYYILSSSLYDCSNGFVFAEEADRKNSCDTKFQKSANNDKVCDLTGRESTKAFAASVDMASWDDRFTVYAVANNSDGSPKAYGCVEGKVFGKAFTPSDCDDATKIESKDKDGNIVTKCPAQRDLTIEVPLNEYPLEIQKLYKTKTILNIGPLMKEGSNFYKALNGVFEGSARFINLKGEISEAIVTGVTKYLNFSGKDFDSTETKECITLATGTLGTCKLPGGDKMSTMKSCDDADFADFCAKNNWNGKKNGRECTAGDKLKEKDLYSGCNCFCHTMYYWTAVNKIGKLAAPLIEKGLIALLEKYLSSDTIEGKVCDFMDSVQFLTLYGDMNFDSVDFGNITGKTSYSDISLPIAGDVKTPYKKAIQGSWNQGLVLNGSELNFKKYQIQFTYGELFYNLILAKAFGFDEEQLDSLWKKQSLSLLDGLFDCSKLKSISIPGLSVDIGEWASGLCSAALAGASGLANSALVDFAVSKSIMLNTDLTGEAVLDRGPACVAGKGGCQAQVIKEGVWSGAASLGADKASGQGDDAVNGIWVAALREDLLPELEYNGFSIEDWKAANSLCHKMVKDGMEKQNGVASNKYCIGGSFDKPDSRTSMNMCAKKVCAESTSVVVCAKNGDFVNSYAKSSAAEIIRAANDACKRTKDGDCTTNDEIINGGVGISNEYCLEHCSDSVCQDNPSIVVCNGDKAYDEAERKTMCEDVDDAWKDANEATCKAGDDGCDVVFSVCYAKKAQEGSIGMCNEPMIVMNKDLYENSEDIHADNNKYLCLNEANPPVAKPEPKVIADWSTFSYYLTDGKANKETATRLANTVGGICDSTTLGDNNKCDYNGIKLSYQCSDKNTILKMVTGKDGVLGALGTAALDGTNCKFVLDMSDADLKEKYKVTSVQFDVLGDDRDIHYKAENDTKDSVYTSSSDWYTIKVDFSGDKGDTLTIWPMQRDGMSSDPADYKVMRLDNIKVWALPNSK